MEVNSKRHAAVRARSKLRKAHAFSPGLSETVLRKTGDQGRPRNPQVCETPCSFVSIRQIIPLQPSAVRANPSISRRRGLFKPQPTSVDGKMTNGCSERGNIRMSIYSRARLPAP